MLLSGPVSEVDRAKLERDKMRQREQERRRREAQVRLREVGGVPD